MTKDSKLLKRPIQLSFDTILVLIKNKKLDAIDLIKLLSDDGINRVYNYLFHDLAEESYYVDLKRIIKNELDLKKEAIAKNKDESLNEKLENDYRKLLIDTFLIELEYKG